MEKAARPRGVRHARAHALGHRAVVHQVAGRVLERKKKYAGLGTILEEGIEPPRHRGLPGLRRHAEVPVAQRHAQNGRPRPGDLALPDLLRQLRRRGREAEGGIGGHVDAPGVDAGLREDGFRGLVADRRDGGLREGGPSHAPARFAAERPDADRVDHQRLAEQGGKKRRGRKEGQGSMVRREHGFGLRSPVVVEETAAPQEDRVARPGGVDDSRKVREENGPDAVLRRGGRGVARDDDGLEIRDLVRQIPQHGGQDGLVAGVAESVIAEDQ